MDQPQSASPDDVKRLLDATHARLTSVGWKQGGIMPPRPDQPACLYFTLRHCAGLSNEETPSDAVLYARRLLIEALPPEVQRYGLTMWNDAAHRVLADVLQLVESVRRKL